MSGSNQELQVLTTISFLAAAGLYLAKVRTRRDGGRNNSKHLSGLGSAKSGLSRLIFLGSGCSGGTPIAMCLLGLIPGRPSTGCEVCQSAYENPTHPNHRRNPSVLLQNPSRTCNTLIDCGKTFREAALTWFPRFDVRGIDHIILTHEHADATFGLDEIRMVQHISKSSPLRLNPPPVQSAHEIAESRRREISDICSRAKAGLEHPKDPKNGGSRQDGAEKAVVQANSSQTKTHPLGAMYDDVIVHCFERTMNTVKNAFPYLVSKGQGSVPRFVSQLVFEPFVLDLNSPFYVKDFFSNGESLQVRPLPVQHGADFMSAGFQFGRKDVVVYISDVSVVPESTLDHLKSIPKIKLFVVDALRPVNYEKATRPMVHFDLADALDCIKSLGKPPEMTLLIGLGHEFDYYTTNEMLKTLPKDIYGKVECSVDGLALDLDL